ncbi:MAG TPA: hypothetical protein VFE71_11135, partial [Bacteroidales bacterium]|nr:hypothetical protein [Bacteroidales bacterium]
FVLITSINTVFNNARDTTTAQVPITTKIIHIFDESEILENLKEGNDFIDLLKKINECNNDDDKNELKQLLKDDKIQKFSPLMHKYIRKLDELNFVEIKNKCLYIYNSKK